MSTNRSIVFALAAAAGTLLSLSGCIARGSSSARYEGTFVSQQTLSMLEPGVSSETDIRDLLGPPTSVMTRSACERVYVYDGRKRSSSSGAVLFIAGASNKIDVRKRVYLLLRDGFFVESWTDPADVVAEHDDDDDPYEG